MTKANKGRKRKKKVAHRISFCRAFGSQPNARPFESQSPHHIFQQLTARAVTAETQIVRVLSVFSHLRSKRACRPCPGSRQALTHKGEGGPSHASCTNLIPGTTSHSRIRLYRYCRRVTEKPRESLKQREEPGEEN
jgi:hypothetical protein